ncbi:hypothetical protein EWD52_23405 [Salmonella enterica subsp. enterica serovar Braenderup]|nr:hypothetical protein [Salmonella enterica subsp. enterica serovar Braenderup]ECD1500246.1 hypothetical protein [Salmonella enterica subsp. enterica serovar Braenderup]
MTFWLWYLAAIAVGILIGWFARAVFVKCYTLIMCKRLLDLHKEHGLDRIAEIRAHRAAEGRTDA